MTPDTAGARAPIEDERAFALGHNIAEWAMPAGHDLVARTAPFHEWANARRRQNVLSMFRSLDGEPGVHATSRFDDGRTLQGMNFGSQDYLGLSTDERVREAGIRAIRDFGVHSASSGMLQGGTRPSLELEAELGDFVSAEHVTLFPTGWGVGFGTITALVRPTDHIIIDRLAHPCLRHGAHATTQNIHRHRHLDVEEATAHIARVRTGDARSGILVITEGTFSMDADAPRLRPLVAACREHEATLLVDVAHDLGQLGLQEVLGEVDLVMGAFSKAFCSCGGFIASRAASVKDYVRVFGGTFTFSNALSAAQAAVALEAVRITRSADGDARRAELQRAASTLRNAFAARGIECYGDPCAIIAVPVGDETVTRLAGALVAEHGVLANLVEFPEVSLGQARFRMQLMPGHSDEMLERAAGIVADAIDEARELTVREGVSA